jgi:1-acyl-sn-glycerol-3-phosphate acyltransferase
MLSSFLYRFVARPLAWFYVKIKFSHKFANKSVLKGLKSGYIIYSNHVTLMGDALIPNLLSVRKRNYILTGKDANSLTKILPLMKCVGNIPLGETPAQQVKMLRAVKRKLDFGDTVTVYPEAHVWPYYTGIRPFSEKSFYYCSVTGYPAIAVTTCFRKRKFFKTPRIVSYIDGPFYPEEGKSKKENAEYLRSKVFLAMERRAAEYSTYSYHSYVKEEEPSPVNKGS